MISTRSLLRAVAGAAILGTLAAIVPTDARAQYFGRNKVQYEDFEFRSIETEHFDLYYYPEEEAAARDAARMAERWYDRLSGVFVHEFEERKPLVFYANKPDFQQTNTTPGFISEATGGFTEGMKNRVVMPFAETYGDTDHVLGHELVHAFQYDLAQQALRNDEGPAGIHRLPLWAIEGLAEYLSLGRTYTHTAMWMRDAVLRDDLPTLEQLSRDPRYFPYRFGHAFWGYVGGRWGDEVVTALYRSVGARGLQGSILRTLGLNPDSLSADWIAASKAHYGPLIEGRSRAADVGRRLIDIEKQDWALAPVVSPDGRRVVFISGLDLFTYDLFVADAETGEVLGKLASASREAHFDALAFTNTSGAFSPDGERFAFVTVVQGDHQIAIADVESRDVQREIELGEVGAVTSLDFSPDGRTIVFSGQAGGVPDLWRVDLASGALERLTDDRFAELHPSISPDGRTIAFATDRGPDADVERLHFGTMGIALMDAATGEIRRLLRPFGDAKHIDPAFSPDGASLYFVSDRAGFSDVFRLDLESGEAYQVTNVATGVSGITDLAPALSVAERTGRLAFSVFDGGDYVPRTMSATEARGRPIETGSVPAPAAVLPPERQEPRALVARYLGDPDRGLPADSPESSREYDPDLALDYVAPPTAGVGVDRFGAQVGGSVGFFWSDLLGDQNLALAVQANGGLEDIGGDVIYADLDRRLNWGVRAGRIPYRSGFVRVTEPPDGGPGRVIEQNIVRTIYNRASLMAEYPFSLTRRVEAEAGFLRVGFDREVIRTLVVNGRIVDEVEQDLDAADALNLGTGSVAFVQDNSFFGFTSPVRGGRSRLEVGGNVGTIDFATVLADWRRYFFARPVTFAVRGMHYGRYGPDAESGRLSALYVGQTSLVRGYSSGSFEPDECTPVPDDPGACPEFERLIGSKLGIVNAEVRVPLIGTERFGLIEGGFLPTELALFVDGGVAWTEDESPEFAFESESVDRIPVFSVGSSLRFNVFGRLVGEFYWAYPFQRPDTGGQFGFQLVPGW
ncbi:MAG: DPP IV N-terminal domain-containing protein [Gemmatimonadota bacterium]|nr:DPP IV N-terminal domain-containing protein [Gemmatimonadota bacterium]